MATADFQRARTAEQQSVRRAVILDTAREMLDEMPLAEISLRELSRRVGLAKSNVVRYFPTREAVFLAVLAEDWTRWLDDLEQALPRQDARRSRRTVNTTVAATVAQSLSRHRRTCDLIAAAQSILEHNIPVGTAQEFKTAAFARTTRLAELVRSRVPAISADQSFEFAGVTWALIAGAWPMANPSPAVATVLAQPEFAALCVDFVPVLTRVLAVFLDGLTS